MAQPRKPKGSPNGTGGQFDQMSHTDMGLPALDASAQPVGGQFMDKTAEIAEKLFDRKQDWDDLPIGGCYRINDFGDYVTEDDWRDVWDEHPLEEKAWMLADNGQYTTDEVAHMSPAEIEHAYDAGGFHPAYVFYTEKYEDNDYDLDEPIGATVADRVRHTGEQLAQQSGESLDFEPGETVHATSDGFVSDAAWERAWGDQPMYVRAAYELSCRHPGLNMDALSPKQIITMNNSEQAYEQYVYASGGAHTGESDLDLSVAQRREADMYRQNERNAQYAGRDLNNVICMREAAYTGNDGTFTAKVQRCTQRVLDSPDPTADMDSLSTIALGLNHDPDNTVDMITVMTATGSGDDAGLRQRLRRRLASPPDQWSRRGAEDMSTLMDCVANNADDTQGAGWLAASLGAFADCRNGDTEQARRTAEEVHEAAKNHEGSSVWRTADDVATAILEHLGQH